MAAKILDKEEWVDILRLRKRGMTLKQIGKMYDVTRERIRQIVSDMDPDFARRRATEISIRRMSESAEKRKPRAIREYFQQGGKVDPVKIGAILGLRIVEQDKQKLAEWIHAEFGVVKMGNYAYCSACRTVKPRKDFMPSERTYICRTCNAIRIKEYYHRRWQERNPQKVAAARQRKWEAIKADPAKHEEFKRKARERYHRSREAQAR